MHAKPLSSSHGLKPLCLPAHHRQQGFVLSAIKPTGPSVNFPDGDGISPQAKLDTLLGAILAASAVSTATAIFAQPVAAWPQHWRPRRHHRRIGEFTREPDLGRFAKTGSPRAATLKETQKPSSFQDAEGTRQPTTKEEKVETGPSETLSPLQQVGSWTQRLKSAVLQQEQKVAASKKAQQFHLATQASPFSANSRSQGFSPLTAGILLVVALLAAKWLQGVLQTVQWGGRGRRKGKWVRDRGLGGKMVFVPEDEIPPPRLVSNTSTAGAASPASVSGRTAPSDPWATAKATGANSQQTPSWWTRQPSLYVEPNYRRDVQQEAQGLINRLMSAKISGQDYDIGTLVSIRQMCGETGATVDAKTQRDPIYRVAADAATHNASEQTNQLGGQTPGRFLSGLATDLGIKEKDAVNMVSSVVASRARSALITACAGYREGDNNEVLVQLLKLAGLITALPLPEKSAHAEMVATGLQQRATLPERQAIFLTYGCMDPPTAALIAELLGFQPALVLPQLHKHIEEGRKSAGKLTEQPV